MVAAPSQHEDETLDLDNKFIQATIVVLRLFSISRSIHLTQMIWLGTEDLNCGYIFQRCY